VPCGVADLRISAINRPNELVTVTKKTREMATREFDARGPVVCITEIIAHLERQNPELLDMAA
jgi:hypothetical protein